MFLAIYSPRVVLEQSVDLDTRESLTRGAVMVT